MSRSAAIVDSGLFRTADDGNRAAMASSCGANRLPGSRAAALHLSASRGIRTFRANPGALVRKYLFVQGFARPRFDKMSLRRGALRDMGLWQ